MLPGVLESAFAREHNDQPQLDVCHIMIAGLPRLKQSTLLLLRYFTMRAALLCMIFPFLIAQRVYAEYCCAFPDSEGVCHAHPPLGGRAPATYYPRTSIAATELCCCLAEALSICPQLCPVSVACS